MDIEEEYDKIFRYCYWKVHNKEIAEDITQETFLRFLQSNYDERGKRIHFLYTIAGNLCIDESRKKTFEDYSENQNHTYSNADDLFTQIYVKQILSQLSEEDRDLMIMRYINREPISDICEVIGISRFALYRRLRGIKKVLAASGKGHTEDEQND